MINETSLSRALVPRIEVDGLGRTLDAPQGANLYRTLRREHVNLHWTLLGKILSCRGVGLCGLCRVRVVQSEGPLPPRNKREARRLRGKPADWRLACYIEVRDDLKVEPFPLVPLEEKVGAEAVRLARLSGEERAQWIETDRGARRDARRRAAAEKLGKRTRKPGMLARLIAKRKTKEQQEGKPQPGEAETPGKKRRFGGPRRHKEAKAEKPEKPARKEKKKAGGVRGLRFGKKKGKDSGGDGDQEGGGAA